MEVFFQEDPLARGPAGNGLGEDASAFFTFQNTQQRDMTISTLLEQLGVCILLFNGQSSKTHSLRSSYPCITSKFLS
jgi:hypothetical protein